MKSKRISSLLASVLALSFVLSACGTTGSGESETNGTTSQGSESPDENHTSESTGSGTSEETTAGEGTSGDDLEAGYPITIEHALGETVIHQKPERIVTYAWGNQDVPLALGVVPVGFSIANFGAVNEDGLLPWTAEALAGLTDETPVIFNDTDGIDYEAINDANPDVILTAYSGITQEDYDLLSQIAPVVAYPDYAWQTYWRDQTLLNAKGMGLEAEANELIAETEELIASKRAAYPDVDGKTAAFIYFNASDLSLFYIYLPSDPRTNYISDLGLDLPQGVLDLADDPSAFTVTISAENIDVLNDVDIIITYGDDAVFDALQADPLVGQIPAVKNGALVMLENNSALAAAGTPSVLSIRATIDEYYERLQAAAENVQ